MLFRKPGSILSAAISSKQMLHRPNSQIGLTSLPFFCRFQGTTAAETYSLPREKQQRQTVAGDRTGPMKHYSSLLNDGILKPDRNQFAVVKQLQNLYDSVGEVEKMRQTGQ